MKAAVPLVVGGHAPSLDQKTSTPSPFGGAAGRFQPDGLSPYDVRLLVFHVPSAYPIRELSTATLFASVSGCAGGALGAELHGLVVWVAAQRAVSRAICVRLFLAAEATP